MNATFAKSLISIPATLASYRVVRVVRPFIATDIRDGELCG